MSQSIRFVTLVQAYYENDRSCSHVLNVSSKTVNLRMNVLYPKPQTATLVSHLFHVPIAARKDKPNIKFLFFNPSTLTSTIHFHKKIEAAQKCRIHI